MLGIIGAMDQEVAAILEKLSDKELKEYYAIKYWKGYINGIECVIGQSGIGKVNAARCTQIMIDKYKPDSIINIGSAGALNPELEIGDVVISSSSIYHDVDLTIFGHEKGYLSDLDDRFIKADKKLIEQCKEVMGKIKNDTYNIMIGPIATGDQFHNDPDIKAELFEEFGAYCDDMEAAAIAHVCLLCEIPYVVIRSISDKPKSKSELTFYDFLDLASARCAEFVDSYTKKFKN
ncbi:5'-methylthioadenosine/adenosylhomocysteine nucleosidase [Natronospora cellulosivora (SeqCode)]